MTVSYSICLVRCVKNSSLINNCASLKGSGIILPLSKIDYPRPKNMKFRRTTYVYQKQSESKNVWYFSEYELFRVIITVINYFPLIISRH
jgi:hypothetical protein